MVRRAKRLNFHGGAYVFPGGKVDGGDCANQAAELFHDWDSAPVVADLGLEDLNRVRGFLVAAVRELFEEAGILLARDQAGQWVDLNGGSPSGGRLLAAREEVAAGHRCFAALLHQEGLRLHAGDLCHFAHWITPVEERKRFDTRFFLASAPPAQDARHDGSESSEGTWIRPQDAMQRYRAKEISMLPPTISSLETLSAFRTPADAIAAASGQAVVTILPKISQLEGVLTMLYPGDSDYEGGHAQPVDGRPQHRRILNADGLWETVA